MLKHYCRYTHTHHLAGNRSKSLSRLWFSPQLSRIKCWSSASVLTHSFSTAGIYRYASVVDWNCVEAGSIMEWLKIRHAIKKDPLIISPFCVWVNAGLISHRSSRSTTHPGCCISALTFLLMPLLVSVGFTNLSWRRAHLLSKRHAIVISSNQHVLEWFLLN